MRGEEVIEKTSAVGFGDDREMEDEKNEQSRSSQVVRIRAPNLGDLGDELACNIVGSVFITEYSDFAGCP